MSLKEFNFEEAIRQLEEIANNLENENTTIDKAIELFEKGIKLSNDCTKYLESVKQKITNLCEAEKGTESND